jgi:ribosomal protein S18 acetylase RimI-like enzyme
MPGAPEITLRPVEPGDREFVRAARQAAFAADIADEQAEGLRADQLVDELPTQIVEDSRGPIGYLCVLHEHDHDFLKEIALVPDAQAAGIGSRLINELTQAAAGRGVSLRLRVRTNNVARRLYERLGFQVTHIEHPRIEMEWRPRPES